MASSDFAMGEGNNSCTGKTSVSVLNELCIAFQFGIPLYDLIGEEGSPDDKTFHIQVQIPLIGMQATGTAKTKMHAKHRAAENLLEQMEKANHVDSLNVTDAVLKDIHEYLKSAQLSKEDPNLEDLTNIPRKLKEWCIETNSSQPIYECTSVVGPPHDRTFEVECRVKEHVTSGKGKSKKIANRLAAAQMLAILTQQDSKSQLSP